MANLRIFTFIIAILFTISSCTESDVVWGIFDDDEIVENPDETTSQLEGDFNDYHFASATDGVIGNLNTIEISDLGFMPQITISGVNSGYSVSLQFPANNLYSGAVLNSTSVFTNRITYTSLTNFSDAYDSINFEEDTDSDVVITITDFDPVNQTISGTFMGTLYKVSDAQETINVANGVFTNVSYETTGISVSNNGFMFLQQQGVTYDLDVENDDGSAAVLFYKDTPEENTISIIGQKIFTDENILLFWTLMFPADSNGTLTIDGVNVLAEYVVTNIDSNSVNYNSNPSGTITIEENTGNYISGTFEYTVYNDVGESVSITNGEFEFDY